MLSKHLLLDSGILHTVAIKNINKLESGKCIEIIIRNLFKILDIELIYNVSGTESHVIQNVII